MAEQELREKVTQAIGEYASTVMYANPTWIFDPNTAMELVNQILALIKEAGYVKLEDNLSNCCLSPAFVAGDDLEGTHYYVCSRCGNPCDIKLIRGK